VLDAACPASWSLELELGAPWSLGGPWGLELWSWELGARRGAARRPTPRAGEMHLGTMGPLASGLWPLASGSGALALALA
jgi:hypothetical protein